MSSIIQDLYEDRSNMKMTTSNGRPHAYQSYCNYLKIVESIYIILDHYEAWNAYETVHSSGNMKASIGSLSWNLPARREDRRLILKDNHGDKSPTEKIYIYI